jgi:protein-S-isoprenylcysteine O-methyltransferase Ste14
MSIGYTLLLGLYGAGLMIRIGSTISWQRLEEAALESRFGEAYRGYRKQTWF